jgi:protein-S-isoprenylcysteine O-methyltransferase Ste14
VPYSSGPPTGGSGGDEDQWGNPSDRAVVRFERRAVFRLEWKGVKVAFDLPGQHAGALLEFLRWVTMATLVVAGPSLTLNALPDTMPAWMQFTVVLVQLVATVYIAWLCNRRGKKPRRK